jgi:hypothetical protein
MKSFFRFINYPRYINWLILASMAFVIFNIGWYKKEQKVIYWDVLEYYGYLPATFIYHDLSLDFVKTDRSYYLDKFWPIAAPNGGHVIKMTMGMAVLYSPFFLIGHIAAGLTGFEQTGFTMPYKLTIQLSALFYLAIGLYYLRKLLQRYFSNAATALTLTGILVGTNLYYYSSVEAPMSHAYTFSLFAIFITLVIKWFDNPNVRNSILLGLLSGLIVLIRPSNIVILLVFAFWGITQRQHISERFFLLLSRWRLVLLMAICFWVVWVAQLLYWHYNTNEWFFYSYTSQKFFFDDPMIMKCLFSYRKGWLLYTPVMFFALLGFIALYKQQREFFYPILIFTVVNFYVISCWWIWWYGGCFGMRPLIESYALLAFPMAAGLDWILKSRLSIRLTGIGVFLLLTAHGCFENGQYYYVAIHYDSMTKKAYWENFGKLHPTGPYWDMLSSPDFDKAMKGDRNQ